MIEITKVHRDPNKQVIEVIAQIGDEQVYFARKDGKVVEYKRVSGRIGRANPEGEYIPKSQYSQAVSQVNAIFKERG